MKKGIFIVIDGIDGSGKSTQTTMIVERLKKEYCDVKTISFPKYSTFSGKILGKCLHDPKYNWVNTPADEASVFYAFNRWEEKSQIDEWLEEGCIVIAARYTSSNQIHQGGKIIDIKEREEFLKWLDKLEHEVYKIPRPDAIFLMDVTPEVAKQLMEKRDTETSREYLEGKVDVHEKDIVFMRHSYETANWLANTQPNWIRIQCLQDGKMRTEAEINEDIYKKVIPLIKESE